MSKRDPKLPNNKRTRFEADALVTPSLIGVVLHLARIAAQADYKLFCETGGMPYDPSEPEGGPT